MASSTPPTQNENKKTKESNIGYLNCFYDTEHMRKYYPENYPDRSIVDSRMIIPGRIICTPEIGLFFTTLVSVNKTYSYTEQQRQIREQMEIGNILIMTPNRKFTSMEDM